MADKAHTYEPLKPTDDLERVIAPDLDYRCVVRRKGETDGGVELNGELIVLQAKTPKDYLVITESAYATTVNHHVYVLSPSLEIVDEAEIGANDFPEAFGAMGNDSYKPEVMKDAAVYSGPDQTLVRVKVLETPVSGSKRKRYRPFKPMAATMDNRIEIETTPKQGMLKRLWRDYGSAMSFE